MKHFKVHTAKKTKNRVKDETSKDTRIKWYLKKKEKLKTWGTNERKIDERQRPLSSFDSFSFWIDFHILLRNFDSDLFLTLSVFLV